MTRYLLDTHIAYWWMTKSARLSKPTASLIGKESCSIRVASLWEMQLKNAAGKLALPPKSLSIEFASEGFSIMPITALHINRPREMSGLRGDPFNLILVAVADIEKMMLFTKQNRLLSLGIRHIKEA